MSKAMDVEQAVGDVKAENSVVEVKILTPTTTTSTTNGDSVSVSTMTNAVTVTALTNGENNGKGAETAAMPMPVTTTTMTTVTTTPAPPAAATTTTTTEPTEAANKGKPTMDPLMINFKVLYVLVQLCGITMIVLVGTWIEHHMGGLGGTDNPKLEFNWHPLLMTIGFIFLYGNSILIYRGFRATNKKTLKLTHAGIHMAAFILTVIALKTVFDSHNLPLPPIPNMYSLHSWLGLSAVIIFCLQYVAGFMAYLVPGMKDRYKIALMPLHIYFGLFGFVLAIASAVMGLTEKAIFSIPTYSNLSSAGVLTNIIGVLYVVFGGLVVYLATEPSYKRKPLPEDTALLTAGNE